MHLILLSAWFSYFPCQTLGRFCVEKTSQVPFDASQTTILRVLANRPDAQRPQGFSGEDAKALHQRQALRRILKGIQNGSYLTSKDDKVGWLKSDGEWLEILDWIVIHNCIIAFLRGFQEEQSKLRWNKKKQETNTLNVKIQTT